MYNVSTEVVQGKFMFNDYVSSKGVKAMLSMITLLYQLSHWHALGL